ncbi:hypothetical protein F5Y17DRAFT_230031 [Xylariaceae sp. FL0594]|nr:hypothetical protein F5Y17DRAFT_230031 [Xylariaceae sp. FL0594]
MSDTRLRFCPTCNKEVPRKNYARHLRVHNRTNYKTCQVCEIKICENGWRQHCRSQAHKDREKQQREHILPNPELLIYEFLNTTTGPLMHLSSAYKQEIERASGLSDLNPDRETQQTRIWADLGLRPPMLFPAAECWQRKPPIEDYMNDLLDGFSKITTGVYSRGKPHDPIRPPPFYEVLRQLQSPDVSSTKYAINMVAESAEIRVPDRLTGLTYYKFSVLA